MAQMEREDPWTKVTARCRKSLKEQYQAVLDDQGRSMSDDLREHMEHVVAEHGDQSLRGGGPDGPQLAEAHHALSRNADPDTHRINTDAAESIASEAAKVVRLKPLEERGYLSPEWGTIVVYPPEKVPAFD
jgi:hypothetical protein